VAGLIRVASGAGGAFCSSAGGAFSSSAFCSSAGGAFSSSAGSSNMSILIAHPLSGDFFALILLYMPYLIYNRLPKTNNTATVVFTIGQIFIGIIDVLAPVNKDTAAKTRSIAADIV
jgi:hypothetical protein